MPQLTSDMGYRRCEVAVVAKARRRRRPVHLRGLLRVAALLQAASTAAAVASSGTAATIGRQALQVSATGEINVLPEGGRPPRVVVRRERREQHTHVGAASLVEAGQREPLHNSTGHRGATMNTTTISDHADLRNGSNSTMDAKPLQRVLSMSTALVVSASTLALLVAMVSLICACVGPEKFTMSRGKRQAPPPPARDVRSFCVPKWAASADTDEHVARSSISLLHTTGRL